MENHHFSWVNPLFLWPCSIAIYVCLPGRVVAPKGWPLGHRTFSPIQPRPSALAHPAALLPWAAAWPSGATLRWCSAARVDPETTRRGGRRTSSVPGAFFPPGSEKNKGGLYGDYMGIIWGLYGDMGRYHDIAKIYYNIWSENLGLQFNPL